MTKVVRLAIALMMVFCSAPSRAEAPSGQSRELGIQFETLGKDQWCAADVKVKLAAARADVFQPDAVTFVQMIGRIRSVLLDACPIAERLLFDGYVGKQVVTAIEMSHITGWAALYTVNPSSRLPDCAPEIVDCPLRADAFVTLHRGLRGDAFGLTRVTTLLDDNTPEHAVWVSGDIVGKLTVSHSGQFGDRFSNAEQLAAAMLFSIAHTCRSGGGADLPPWSEQYKKGTVAFGITCREKDGTHLHHAFAIPVATPLFRVFSFFEVAASAESVSNAARHVVANFESGN